jgi:HK97 family phage prohead protease
LPAVEQRTAKLDRSNVAADGRSFTGHAAVFGQPTDIGNPFSFGFVEQVAAGAFADSIRAGDVVMLADHDPSKPIARQSVGTLLLSEDATGLATSVPNVPSVTYGNDLVENLRVGNVRGMSFGFTVSAGGDSWTTATRQGPKGPATVDVRTLNKVNLIEVSTTAFPAYPTTDAAVRSARAHRPLKAATGRPVRRRLSPLDQLRIEKHRLMARRLDW